MTKTFLPRQMDGLLGKPLAYKPMIVIVGSEAHRLALHLQPGPLPDEMKEWIVSDPVTGISVCRVRGSYKGAQVSTRGMRPTQIREFALACVEELVQAKGSAVFNAKMAEARAKWARA